MGQCRKSGIISPCTTAVKQKRRTKSKIRASCLHLPRHATPRCYWSQRGARISGGTGGNYLHGALSAASTKYVRPTPLFSESHTLQAPWTLSSNAHSLRTYHACSQSTHAAGFNGNPWGFHGDSFHFQTKHSEGHLKYNYENLECNYSTVNWGSYGPTTKRWSVPLEFCVYGPDVKFVEKRMLIECLKMKTENKTT